MCKKVPEQCKAKVKCKCCKEKLDSNLQLQGISKKFLIDKEQETGKLNLNEVDNNFEQQHYIIDLKGE